MSNVAYEPTGVNELAMSQPIEWFENNLLGMVPLHFKGVGHYGVFNGKRWKSQIYPVVRNQIRSAH